MAEEKVKSTAKTTTKGTTKASTKNTAKGRAVAKTKSASSASGKNRAKITARHKRFGDTILDEIILILVIAASIVVIISLLSQKMGIVGHFISSFLKGGLGIGSIFVPLIAIAYSLWLLISEEKNGMFRRLSAAVLAVLCLSAAASTLFPVHFDASIGALSKTNYYFDNGGFINGGVIGGWLGSGLLQAFDKLGSVLILLVLLLISIILGTGKSFFQGIGLAIEYHKSKKLDRREKIKTKAARIKVQEDNEADKRAKRDARKASGGLFNFVIEDGEEDDYESSEENKPLIAETVFTKAKRMLCIKERKPVFDYETEDLFEEDPANAADLDNDFPENTVLSQLPSEEVYVPPLIHSSGGFLEDDEDEQDAKILAFPVQEDKPPMPLINENAPYFDPTIAETLPLFIENPVAFAGEVIPLPLAKKTEESEEQKGGVHTLIPSEPEAPYIIPPLELLGLDTSVQNKGSKVEMLHNAKKLEDTLKSFGVEATVMQINKGPTVTRYELSPSKGVKVSKIVNLSDDIALNLAASGIRIEAPIPGKAAVGIEVPNKETQSVYLRSVMQSETFQKFPSRLAIALGQDIAGNPVVTDIAKMPHLLIAGATGSGKSVCINTIITSILYKANPKEVKLLLVDPKVVELSVYNGIPHLLIPVVTDPKKAASALNWAVREMLARYNDFAAFNVRDISGFNAMKREKGEEEGLMAQIVIIIDELADLMMAVPGEVEDSICRLAQMARAAGMHLIIATQRPSVDVITGVIKANIPSRLAFAVSSGIDSRTILDMVGAEKLLGKGDMLFYPAGMSKPQRIQGAFVTDKEVESIVQFVKRDGQAEADLAMIEKITSSAKMDGPSGEVDEFFDQAVDLVVEKEKASASMLQRQFRIGYNRASRLIEDLESNGIVGPEDGSKPRKVLLTKTALYEMRNPSKEED